ncbi:hypothetical protein [Pseudomonas sp. SWRI81]|uniref:hypothetical protein n=1 Tax=Pseudomonas sp. SWRI81 TaxID=2745505 RepID=UPI001EE19041|nr:hypothetical protein [Pseudomonas sp. SWRI81]
MEIREVNQYAVRGMSGTGRDKQTMGAISREEFDAKIETIETRMDGRVAEMRADIRGFLAAQAERDKAYLEREKTQQERDKRYDLMWAGVQKIADDSREAIRQASTVKANYWAATTVHFLGVASLLVGAHFANQAAVLTTIQTTLAAIQIGKEVATPKPVERPSTVQPQ